MFLPVAIAKVFSSSLAVAHVFHLLTGAVACLCAAILLTIYFSPRERAWRKWRRGLRRKYGSA
jgi:hypothetical protein